MREITKKPAVTPSGLALEVKAPSGYLHPHSNPTGGGRQVYNGRGQIVGKITPCGVFTKQLDPARHKLRQPSGWAVDAEHLRLGWHTIHIETTGGETWEASKDAFLAHGVELARGHGRQVCLPDQFWSVRRPGQPIQLELWGVTPDGWRQEALQ